MTATREIKVGLFVFIAFVLLAVMIFSISDFYSSQAQYTYPLRVRFTFVNGIDPGAPVRVAGVKVGEVRTVGVYRDEATQRVQVELGVRISKDAVLEEDSVATINTLGLLGEKYLEVIPGTPGKRALGADEILVGKDSVSTEKLVETTYQTVEELQKATVQMTLFLTQANDMMAKVNRGEGTIGQLLANDDLYRDIKDFSEDIKAHPWKLFFRPKEKRK